MHEITRHTIHVAEVIAVTIQTFEKFRVQQEHIYASLADVLGKGYREQAKEYLSFQLQMIRSLRERSISNHERLKSEIIVVGDHSVPLLSGRELSVNRHTTASPNRTTG
jgi:hypothetical protein